MLGSIKQITYFHLPQFSIPTGEIACTKKALAGPRGKTNTLPIYCQIDSFCEMEITGLDSDGKTFENVQEMWKEQIGEGDEQKKSQWYREGVSYWEVST